jgi:hypothetical protein
LVGVSGQENLVLIPEINVAFFRVENAAGLVPSIGLCGKAVGIGQWVNTSKASHAVIFIGEKFKVKFVISSRNV